MSNKEIIQENNLKILENNNNLSSVLDTVNNLPTNVKIRLQEKTVIPSTEQQDIVADENYTGLSKVTINKITENNLEITPSSEEQTFNGVYTDVTVNGEPNLSPENIKEGTTIFGVKGTAKTATAKITNCNSLFSNGRRTDYLNELLAICENVTDMSSMFVGCSQLTTIDVSNLDTSKVIYMSSMFSNCTGLTSLDISSFNTSNVTSMKDMFNYCTQLTSLNVSNLNTSNVTNMSRMFGQCTRLTSLNVSNLNTSKVANISYMFSQCTNLTELDISDFDLGSVINIYDIFYGCSNLTNLVFGVNYGKGFKVKRNGDSEYALNLSNNTNLTYESLMSVINNLYDLNLSYNVANGGTLYTQKLILGSTNLAKLTAEEIAIATNKGWTVS